MQYDVMKKAEREILAVFRTSGVSAIEDADAVILETDGSFNVITNIDDCSASALKDVRQLDRNTMARAN